MLRGVHFVLEECAVDHLVLEAFVVECHDVQRLDDFGAISTAERSVGREAQRRLQRSDTADEDLFGEVLALTVSIEDGEDEGGELVTARDSAEGDACSLPITEDAEAKDVSGTYLSGDLGAGAGDARAIVASSSLLASPALSTTRVYWCFRLAKRP